MAVLSESEKEILLAKELAIKLKAESILSARMSRLFRKISRDVSDIFVALGEWIDVGAYQDDIVDILNRSYTNVSGKVSGDEVVRLVGDDIPFGFRELSQLGLIDFIERSSQDRAAKITNTTRSVLRNIINGVFLGAALLGVSLTNRQAAKMVSGELLNKNTTRAETISVTEILNAVEGTKEVERSVLQSFGLIPVENGPFKEWSAILDAKTRPDHFLADGQQVVPSDPFQIGEWLMMYPGDTSLGAPLSQIINCRCSTFMGIAG